MQNFHELERMAYKKIEINKDYRFLNSHYCFDDNTIPFLKHDNIVESLINRIKYTKGGAFLITGLRGVGKTTLVKCALHELNKDKKIDCLSIYINLSRKISYDELLFEIIRRLYESALDGGILNKIEKKTKDKIELAYKRTSMNISSKNKVASDIEAKGSVLESLSLRQKLTMQSSEDIAFLAYSVCDIEHDLLRIIDLFNKENKMNLKIVIIFDELDKLTTNQDGIEYFEEILGRIKNVLCSSELISIFIGDIDLYNKCNNDLVKINSLYNSIFSWHQYVPCIWDSMEPLLNIITERKHVYERVNPNFQYMCDEEFTKIIRFPFKALLIYINFKSKGIPRNIFFQLNRFISWKNEIPYFQFTPRDIKIIKRYNYLWEKLESIFYDKTYKTLMERDLRYVVCFNLVDYLFSHAEEAIDFEDIKKDLLYKNIFLNEQFENILIDLMKKFSENHIVRISKDNKYIVSDYIIKTEDYVTMTDSRLFSSPSETTNLLEEYSKSNFTDFESKIRAYNSKALLLFWENYEVKSLLKSNLEMTIYLVVKRNDGTKYLAILYTDKYSQRFKNTNCIYTQDRYEIANKYLINTIDFVIDGCIKTSLNQIYDGYLLAHLIEARIKEECILLIAKQVLEFVKYMNGNAYFNVGIGANNILMDSSLNIKILDIKSATRLFNKKPVMRMRGYAAPELYTNNYDKTCDVYAIGILLWEMVSGQSIENMEFDEYIDIKVSEKPNNCSKQLWKIILKATKINSKERYQSAGDMLNDIVKCKEYREVEMLNNNLAKVCTLLEKDIKEPIYQEKKNYGETVILGYEVGIDNVHQTQALLFRKRTNEIVFIDKPIFEIGKNIKEVDFAILNNDTVSRKHACIKREDNKYYLSDCFSTNGTFINDEQILCGDNVELRDNDLIKLANEEFIFKIE